MAGKNIIEIHPKRAQIERDIIKGESAKTIVERYSTPLISFSEATVLRHKRKHMAQALRHAQLEEVDGLIGRINEYMDSVEDLKDSILTVLDDPENPGHICYHPNANEIKVKYYNKDTEKMALAKLQDLLGGVQEKNKAYFVKGVFVEGSDPRLMLLKTADNLTKNLELLCKAKGYITEDNNITINAGASGTVEDIANIAREALAPYPEALDAFVNALLDAAAKGDRELMANTGEVQK